MSGVLGGYVRWARGIDRDLMETSNQPIPCVPGQDDMQPVEPVQATSKASSETGTWIAARD